MSTKANNKQENKLPSKKQLFSDAQEPEHSADEFDENKININPDYAIKYAKKKAKEELQTLQEKYGDVDINDNDENEPNSEDNESEDENGDAITPETRAKFLNILNSIKQKDAKLYNKDTQLFSDNEDDEDDEEEEEENEEAKQQEKSNKKKEKKFTLLDHEQRWFTDTQGDHEYASDEDTKKKLKIQL